MESTNNEPELSENVNNDIDEHDGGIRIGDIYIPPPPMPACTFDTTGPRLIITEIENVNFKSYAAHQSLGPFHKNFTAIIGPNGSGKSNVIDAMLFVFGYRAQKIRSKKVGVLVHNSDKYPDLQSCTVKVHFQMIIDKGDHEYEVVPNSSFYIARTAYKDNSSVYEIDGRRVQFKQVSKLLRSYGIDLDHNRFLILQGEIEMIAMMKPKGNDHDTGMLEYLEDIIGCNRFIEPIQQLLTKVEECNEIRTEKLNRVKLVEKEKQDLEAARSEALEFVKLENKVTLMENSVLQVRLRDAEVDLESAIESRDATKKKLETLSLAQEELKDCHMVKEKEHKEVHQGYEKCLAAVEECKERYSEMERQDATCRDNINNFKAKLKKLIKSLEAEEEKLNDLKKQPDVHEGEASELLKKKDTLVQKKEVEEKKLKEVMASMKQETGCLQEEKDKFEAELIQLKKNLNEAKSEMDIARSELDLYLSTEENEKKKLRSLEELYEEATNSVKEKQRLHEEAEQKIPAAEELIKKQGRLLQQITEKEAKISEEIKLKRVKVEEAKSSFRTSKNRGVVLQSLMEQKECGAISGMYGRLGDLGAIDEKYDVAISTACGRLDNIVTDTITTAQKCVEFLKRNNKGYATFIALDKMQKWVPYTKQKFSAPENVPRLFDLVKVKDPKVLPAFYFALRDTLVAQDLEQATRISLHGATRYRSVTLKGEVIDLAGTMSGGGGRMIKGRMGQSVANPDVSLREIEKMSQNLDDLIKSAEDLRQEKVNVEDCMNQTQKELFALQKALKKNSMEYAALKERVIALSKQIEEQKPKIIAAAPDKAKVQKLQNRLENAKKRYEESSSATSKIDDKVQSLHSEIVSITKGKFGAVHKNVNKLTKEIDTVQVNITKCKVAAKTAMRNQKKSEDKIINLQEEIEQVKGCREKLMKEFKELEGKATEVLAQKEKVIKEMSVWEEKKKSILQEIGAIKETELKLKSENIELKNEMKTKEAAVKEKSVAVKQLKAKLEKLELQVVDDDDGDTTPSLPKLSTSELDSISVNAILYEMGAVQTQMSKMKPNMAAIAEYKKKEELYKKKLKELEDITKERDDLKKCHDDLRKQRLEEFMAGFKIITSKLKEIYQMITLGGDAELELVDSLDPFTEGIIFSVRPPKKSWKNITNLSGGEKTLSSLALVFALHYYKPTPFYVMDEIDAALDFKNVSIVGNYIKERTKNAQFIIISLRNNMFELADRLVGIYKTYNCTKSATISPHEIADVEDECENEQSSSTAAGTVAVSQNAPSVV